ncbi:S-adenosyl-L-methionine-dependent methyltransferase [Lasiosphaeria miniovina]|uniref:Leucine carboxyl methyltransferase 1 n=1 Tax=Lasiosphaeria miniovina TaxID=1954250 RepID=A0AA40E2V0_9PEZI|nr:S-adenosyl-L-methionine-dependent methyltransferase [Lasiosphaeria miniovina]KAK0722121.1 S-adenosyl-L-methionine-dependent methyltransferase [Lasiosphaeria miniovina]
MSAVELGYLDDPFAALFAQPQPHPYPHPQQQHPAAGPGPAALRRLPIINRGTYARTAAIDRLVTQFLADTASADGSSGGFRQIVSLGAGTDTRSLRLFSSSPPFSSTSSPCFNAGIIYHEIDFPAICARKLRAVRAAPQLRAILSEPETSSATITSQQEGQNAAPPEWWTSRGPGGSELWCHGLDLRALALAHQQRAEQPGDDNNANSSLIRGLRADLPTLLLSECCLCYLSAADAGAVVGWFGARISPAAGLGLVLYEAVHPDDAFGRMMVSNLAARGLRMPTLDVFRTGADQERRLRAAGFDEARQLTVDAVWERWVAPAEKERVDGLEGLDELEEWNLLASHYIVAWGWRGSRFRLVEP